MATNATSVPSNNQDNHVPPSQGHHRLGFSTFSSRGASVGDDGGGGGGPQTRVALDVRAVLWIIGMIFSAISRTALRELKCVMQGLHARQGRQA